MKNTKLSLKKETIEQLTNQTMHNIAGGNESANTACIANTGANCLWGSRALCITIAPKWDCGGTKTNSYYPEPTVLFCTNF